MEKNVDELLVQNTFFFFFLIQAGILCHTILSFFFVFFSHNLTLRNFCRNSYTNYNLFICTFILHPLLHIVIAGVQNKKCNLILLIWPRTNTLTVLIMHTALVFEYLPSLPIFEFWFLAKIT